MAHRYNLYVRAHWLSIPLICGMLFSCGSSRPPVTLHDLARDYVYTFLSLHPSIATAAGYHTHPGLTLDDKLETFSQSEQDRLRDFLGDYRQRFRQLDAEALDPQERADYEMIQGHMRLVQIELDTLQPHRRNPTMYVELAGSAIHSLYTLNFAPLEERFDAIIARLGKIPALVEQAKRNLATSPEIWIQVALDENEGNRVMLMQELREACPPSRRVAYDTAAGIAVTSLQQLNAYLEQELSKHPDDWRLGREKFDAKFAAALGINSTPAEVLAEAESQLQAVRKRMFEIALPMHQKSRPGSKAELNTVVRETLNEIAKRHGTRESYMSDAQRDLEEAREFVRRKNIVPLPENDNLKIIPTPEFMRGIYSVGGFNPAPPLEPQLGAFYWLTPIPEDWPPARVESKLREYNYYGVKLLTIHEAIPGHYLQFEYANAIPSKTRRLLRSLFGNNPYIEGWAVYATETMLDEGFLDNDPQLRLTFLKQQLRMISNAILDIRLHTMNMTDEQAMDLMINQTFQEKEEATGKLRRAKLSSTQLCTYFTGWLEWRRLRESVQKTRGGSFNLAGFHREALEAGAVPMPQLQRLLSAAK
ncbi:MAG: DUF885 domain-containing protein [Acidimicrobiia bacterium]|nr:DUF885 domain-containing protein [Acidimicrobiia bacterium]